MTKKYHDDNLASINGNLNRYQKKSDKITLNQNMDANNFNIKNVKAPKNSSDADNWSFFSQELSNYFFFPFFYFNCTTYDTCYMIYTCTYFLHNTCTTLTCTTYDTYYNTITLVKWNYS